MKIEYSVLCADGAHICKPQITSAVAKAMVGQADEHRNIIDADYAVYAEILSIADFWFFREICGISVKKI